MKKILSLICVFAFIASFVCTGISAEDIVSFSMIADEIPEDADAFTADIVVHLPEGVNVTQFCLLVDVPAGLTLESFSEVYNDNGMFTCSETYFSSPYMIFWVSGTESLPAGDTILCTLTFKINATNVSDTEYVIGLELDPDNKPASVNGDVVEATANGCTVIDVVATEATTTTAEPTQTTVTTPRSTYITNIPGVTVTWCDVIEVTNENGDVVTDDDGNTVTETVIVTEMVTDAPADTNTDVTQSINSPNTGDAVFTALCAMVVALGCAIIVRKVNI